MKCLLFAAALCLAPAACGAAAEKAAGDPPAAAPAKQAGAEPPPLPHADRKDDPTVLVTNDGDPPLTQGMLDRNLDVWEWVLDLRVTDAQRAQWQKAWMDGWGNQDDVARHSTLLAVRSNLQTWDGMARQGALERDLLRLQWQAPSLAFLRKSGEQENKLLADLYDEAHNPGGERNTVLAAGDPPLTRDMADLYLTAMEYVLDLGLTDGQSDEFRRALTEDWKQNDPKRWAKNIESWRKPLSMRPYDRRIWRARERPALREGLRKIKYASNDWLLAAYEEAHEPGGERNPVLADGDPPLTRDAVDQYCDMAEAVLDFSVSGGLTDVQRRDVEELLVKDWKGMDREARADFLRTLQKWPSPARLLVQLRAAQAGDQRSQYLLEIHKQEQDKVARIEKAEQQRHELVLSIIRNMEPHGRCVFNATTGEYEWRYDP